MGYIMRCILRILPMQLSPLPPRQPLQAIYSKLGLSMLDQGFPIGLLVLPYERLELILLGSRGLPCFLPLPLESLFLVPGHGNQLGSQSVDMLPDPGDQLFLVRDIFRS